MIEIIVAIILQVTTLLGGVSAEKGNAEIKAKEQTEIKGGKPDQSAESGGGQGGWAG